MTPRRVDVDSVTAELQLMEDALGLLASTDGPSATALRQDGLLRGAVERYLMLLVDQAVAINLDLVAAALPHAIEHYGSYVQAIARFLRARPTPGGQPDG